MLVVFSTLSAHSAPRQANQPSPDLPFAAAIATGGSVRRRRTVNAEPIAASYSRYSSDQQNDSSISDQQREIGERANSDGNPIARRFEYTDEAVSGTLLRRDGLDRLLADARTGLFNVLYFFNLSRLARESVITLPLLKNLVYNFGVRVISCKEGLDTNRSGWEMIAAIFSVHHEQFIRDLSDNVKKGQQGTVLARFSVGDWRFGYHSVPSPGGEMVRRGGDQKPRKVYAIKESEAHWVRQVFQWFVREERTLGWIVKELNRLAVARDRRATRSRWHRQIIVRMLRSTKYIGLWPWGETECFRDPLTGVVRSEPRPAEECQKWLREFPELRVVDDETFHRAQVLLNEQAAKHPYARRENGRLNGSDGSQAQRHLLHRLFRCEGCESTLICGGYYGKYLMCPAYRDGTCANRAMMPRSLAEKLLLDLIAERILANEQWIEVIYQSMLKAWHDRCAHSPGLAEAARHELQQLDQKIERLVDLIENASEPDPGLVKRLAERRREQKAAARRLQELDATVAANPAEPTREYVRERLNHLHEVLTSAAPVANTALKALLNAPIIVRTVTVPGRNRPYWQGTVRLSTSQVVGAMALPVPVGESGELNAEPPSESCEEITLDFVLPLAIDRQVVRSWELLQQRQPLKAIAVDLGVKEARMTAIMKVVAERYGNGLTAKQLREQFRAVSTTPKAVEAYVERAMEMIAAGKLLGEIAQELGTHRNMITAAIRAGYAARGLPAPDGRTRRKTLTFKGQSSWVTRCSRQQSSTSDEHVQS